MINIAGFRKKSIAFLCVVTIIFGFMAFSPASITGALPDGVMANFYVSPDGDDSADGTSAANPLKTVQKAKEKVREINADMTGDINVYLMGGMYHQTEALEFTPEDSATNAYRINYCRYDDNAPIVSGGYDIHTDWEEYANPNSSNKTYRTYIGDIKELQSKYVNDNFSNGSMASYIYENTNAPDVSVGSRFDPPIAIDDKKYINKLCTFEKQETGIVSAVISAKASKKSSQLLFELVSDKYLPGNEEAGWETTGSLSYNTNSASCMYFAGDGNLRYIDRSINYDNFQSFGTGQDYLFQMDANLDTRTVDYYLNGNLIVAGVPFFNDEEHAPNINALRYYTNYELGAYEINYMRVVNKTSGDVLYEDKNANKYLNFNANGSAVKTNRPFQAQSGNFSISFDIKPFEVTGEFHAWLSDSAGKVPVKVSFGSNGQIQAHSASGSRNLMRYDINKNVNLKIEVNKQAKTYNVYAGATKIGTDIPFIENCADIIDVTMSAGPAAGVFNVDNLLLTNGSGTVFKDEIAGDMGGVAKGFLPIPATAKLVDHESNKKMEFSLAETSKADYASSVSKVFGPLSGNYTFEFKIRPLQSNADLDISLSNRTHQAAAKIRFTKNGKIVNVSADAVTDIGTYTANTEYTVLFSVDYVSKTYSLSINGDNKGTYAFFDPSIKDSSLFKLSTYQKGSYYLDDLTAVSLIKSRSLYVNSKRAQIARTESTPQGFVRDTTNYLGFYLPKSGFYANMANWQNPNDIEMNQRAVWAFPWGSVDYIENGFVYMKQPFFLATSQFTPPIGPWGAGMSYPETILNAIELLDQPGEWYQNRGDGYLYYIPRAGEDMKSATFILGTLSDEIVKMTGSDSRKVENITFDGLQFSYNTWMKPATNEGIETSQGGVGFGTAITLGYVQGINIVNCKVTSLSTGGILMQHGVQNCKINNNQFIDIGIDAIDAIDARNIEIMHNEISGNGAEFLSSTSVFLYSIYGSKIEHNTIYDAPYTAISIGVGHGRPDEKADSTTGNNTVRYNRIYNTSLELHDSGPIYVLGEQKGMLIQYNYVSLNQSRPGDREENGIYLDNGSEYITIRDNVIESLNGSGSLMASNWLPGGWGEGEFLQSHYNSFFDNYFTDSLMFNSVHATTYIGNNVAVKGSNYPEAARRIIDSAGVGKQAVFDAETRVSDIYDDSVAFNGAWLEGQKTGALDIQPTPVDRLQEFKMGIKQSNKAGDSIQWSFNGNTVYMFGKRGPAAGEFEVYIDNKLFGTYSAYQTVEQVNAPVFHTNNLTPQAHTIRVVVKSGFVYFDSFESRKDSMVPYYYVNDNDAAIKYSGKFSVYKDINNEYYGSDAHVTSAANDSLEFTFQGTGVEFLTTRYMNGGSFDVYVDGIKQATVSCHDTNQWTPGLRVYMQQSMFCMTELAMGTHTIRIVNRSNVKFYVDAFKVYTTPKSETGEYLIAFGSNKENIFGDLVEVSIIEGERSLIKPQTSIVVEYTFKNGAISKVVREYSTSFTVSAPGRHVKKLEVSIFGVYTDETTADVKASAELS